MGHRLTKALPLLLALGACRTATVTSEPHPTQATTTPAGPGQVPVGTTLDVKLDQDLSTDQSHKGDTFTATLVSAVNGADGQVLLPAGSKVEGTVTGVAPSAKYGDQAAIRLDFNDIVVGGTSHPLSAEVVSAKPKAQTNTGRVGKGAGIGAAGGALLGAVLGKSVKGAVIGGLLGAGTGTVISLGTGEVQAKLPAGSEMKLRTDQIIDVG